NRNYHSDRADYDSGDRAGPAACHDFREVAKSGAQPEPARPRLVRRLCVGASIRITAAGAATAAIMHQAGDPSRGPVSEFGTTVQPLSRRQTIALFEMGRSSPCIDWSTNLEKSACRSGAGHTRLRVHILTRLIPPRSALELPVSHHLKIHSADQLGPVSLGGFHVDHSLLQ